MATSKDLLLDTEVALRPPSTVPLPILNLRQIFDELVKPRGITSEVFLRMLVAGSEKWWNVPEHDFPAHFRLAFARCRYRKP
ncbi:uncharacterized protein N0V89_001077 [Didymosphaeria variabile]|uniref:Uncharacterized protein n=1 Tax=Didymosphaeria variabile TaxID=1932322 RepID=A0A9W9CGD1_9PLEO|nr:uncharacterized protein N0V89_001077 [Didymosphaeria variabile]KAJ4360512.1 hypothetical protein N0V89_001077 [Didymosphaeria variabile]